MWFAHPGSKIYQNLCQNCGRNAIFRAIPCGEKFFGPVEFTSFWGFFTPKRAPGAPNGGLGGQLRVIWVRGKREHPAIKKKLGGKIFFPEMVLDPLSHSLLKSLLSQNYWLICTNKDQNIHLRPFISKSVDYLCPLASSLCHANKLSFERY